MDERRRKRNREGRGGTTRLNRSRRRLAESMPSPGLAQPSRVAKPRLWPTGGHQRRPERRGGGRVLRRCKGGLKAGRGTRNDAVIFLSSNRFLSHHRAACRSHPFVPGWQHRLRNSLQAKPLSPHCPASRGHL